jgi:hypothetical protein
MPSRARGVKGSGGAARTISRRIARSSSAARATCLLYAKKLVARERVGPLLIESNP